MKDKIKIFFLIWVGIISAYSEVVFSNSKKLEDELFVYDSRYQKLVPMINSNVNTVHFVLNTKLYHGQYLRFNSGGVLSVFVNNKIFKKYINNDDIILSVDDILKVFGPNELLITLYSPRKLSGTISSLYLCTLQNNIIAQENGYRMISRSQFVVNQSFLLGMILLFVLFYAVQNGIAPFFFRYVYNPINLFRDLTGDDLINVARLDSSKIIFVLFDSLVISSIYLMTNTNAWQPTMLSKMLILALYIISLIFLKYIYNQIVAYVFRINNYSFIQVFQFLRHCMVFSLALLCLYLIFCSPFTFFRASGTTIFDGLLLILVVSYIAKVIFSLKKVINLRSFYFISYICVSELIPVILFLVYYFSRIDKGIS